MTATAKFVLYRWPYKHVRCVFALKVWWVFIKNVSRQWELAGVNVDKNVLCTWMLSILCSDTVTRDVVWTTEVVSHTDGWAEAEGGRGVDFKVWWWWKVPEVKTGSKWWSKVSQWTGLAHCSFSLPSNNPSIDSVFPNEFLRAMWDFFLAILHLLSLLDESVVLFPHSTPLYSWVFF